MERIAASQQAHSAPLVEIDDPAHDTDEVVHVRLEQLIPRISLEDVQHSLAIVTVRIEPKVLDHALDFAADDGDVARTAEVRARGPQPQEPVLARDAASVIERLDADVVQILGSMDGRNRVGFGDVEDRSVTRPGADVAPQPGHLGTRSTAQDAEP